MDILSNIIQTQTTHAPPQKMLRMVKNERMGGYVPKWETPKATPQSAIEQNLSQAQNARAEDSAKNPLAYYGKHGINGASPAKSKEFTFGDMIDIVNPLHHIPVVNHAYRSISGDEIKPIGRIVGGGIFGGPLGVIAGLINVVSEEETGKDVLGNAMAVVINGEAPSFKTKPEDIQVAEYSDQHSRAKPNTESPQARLNEAVQIAQDYEDLSNSLLAFSDLGYSTGITIERLYCETGRAPKTPVPTRT